MAFRKRRQIDLLKVLVQAAAAMGNQEALGKYYEDLLEAVDPEIKEIRRARRERDLKLVEEESQKEYIARDARPQKPKRKRHRR